MASHAFFAGSFDPFTLGHLDLVRRAQALFGRVTVGVAHDPAKHSRFSAAERVELVRQCVVGLSGVEVVQFSDGTSYELKKHGLTADHQT